jgi:hypothetical protein
MTIQTIKSGPLLQFLLDDGSTVQYNLATQETIGKKGKPVKSLASQLREYSIYQILESFSDKNYADYLAWCWHDRKLITNFGTVLKYAKENPRAEQYFAAGYGKFVQDSLLRHRDMKTVPIHLLNLCKRENTRVNDALCKLYENHPDAFSVLESLELITTDKASILAAIQETTYTYPDGRVYVFESLLGSMGYKPKPLFLYLDRLHTFEAISPNFVIRELYDYAKQYSSLSMKFDRYPTNFLTTKTIADRTYRRLKIQVDEEKFTTTYDESLEWSYKNWVFICPKKAQEIKDEAVMQNNCVASYIQDVLDGSDHIIFMRRKEDPDKSVVTVEVVNNEVVQAYERFNNPLNNEERDVLNKYQKHLKELNNSGTETRDASKANEAA